MNKCIYTKKGEADYFFDKLSSYNNCPTCIKINYIPVNTYLLGVKDYKWFLGINSDENPETVKPIIETLLYCGFDE